MGTSALPINRHLLNSAVERLRTWIVERHFQIPTYSFDTFDTVPRKRRVA